MKYLGYYTKYQDGEYSMRLYRTPGRYRDFETKEMIPESVGRLNFNGEDEFQQFLERMKGWFEFEDVTVKQENGLGSIRG